ncbi:DUF2207 domain-containing protein [Bifidobacterium sp. ESL0704]|uniref:DUF2207 family protein n=1 Tax=Bifidobacterium sp. ESL0704 TaxID=2983219 RepID=UPI0023F643D1|nr:DUF2207 domain-containing protein [Bifidobacterium sp. ESL0704]WEV53266.1 DUF2207 domain-containing protein [Bifidobacterium sp. ESL0704]
MNERLSLGRVLRSIPTALVFSVISALCMYAFYWFGTTIGGEESTFRPEEYQHDCKVFVLLLIGYVVVSVYVIIIGNVHSKFNADVAYCRDIPAMSPGCAALFGDLVDPPAATFSRILNVGSAAVAATMLDLQRLGAIAVYPGEASDYDRFDLDKTDDTALQSRARQIGEQQWADTLNAQAQVQSPAQALAQSDAAGSRRGRHARKRARLLSHHLPGSGGWFSRLLWKTSLGSKLRSNIYGQLWTGDVAQPQSLVSTVVVSPAAFNDPESVQKLSGPTRELLRFLVDFAQWKGNRTFDLNELRSACSGERDGAGELDNDRNRRGSENVWQGGARSQSRFFIAVRHEFRSLHLTSYDMPSMYLWLAAASIAFLGGLHPLGQLWDMGCGATAIVLGAVGIFLAVMTMSLMQPYRLNEQGKRIAAQLVGLKRYLRDYSDFSGRGISDLPVWGQYLIYATALGLSDRTVRQLGVYLYPMDVAEIYNYYGYDYGNGSDASRASGAQDEAENAGVDADTRESGTDAYPFGA